MLFSRNAARLWVVLLIVTLLRTDGIHGLLYGNATLRSSGVIHYDIMSEVVSTADDLLYWSHGDPCTLMLDTADKKEGEGSVVCVGDGTPGTWPGIWYNPPGTWDFSRWTRVGFQVRPDTKRNLVVRLHTDWEDFYQWNLEELDDVIANQWNYVEVELVKPDVTYGQPNISTIDFIQWRMNQRSGGEIFKIDNVVQVYEPLPPEITITPESAYLYTGQQVSFDTEVYYAEPPYTIEWYLDDVYAGTGTTFAFAAGTPGNFTLYAVIAESLGQRTMSSPIPIVVESGGFLEIRAYANGHELYSAVVEVVGVGRYYAPTSLGLGVGTYTVRASYGSQSRSQGAEVVEGEVTFLEFNFAGEPSGFSALRVEGRWIKDEFGNTVILRGVKSRGFPDHPAGKWMDKEGVMHNGEWNEQIIKDNLDAIRNYGFNVFRVFISVDFWLNPASGARDYMKQLVGWAGERGIYVVLAAYCVVHYGEPGHRQTPLPFPPYLNEYEEAVIPDEQTFIDLWRSIAEDFRSYPNVLFELWSEPGAGIWTEERARQDWWRVAEACINAIREASADHIIVFQWTPGVWCHVRESGGKSDLSWIEQYPVNDPLNNILYSTHVFRRGGGTGLNSNEPDGKCYTYEDVKTAFQTELVHYAVTNLSKPLIIGSTGVFHNSDVDYTSELEGFRNTLKILNELEISYVSLWWGPDGSWKLLLAAPDYQLNEAGQMLADAVSANGSQ